MRIKFTKIILVSIAVFMAAVLVAFISIDKYKEKQIQIEKEHVIISTVVTDKYYEEGYCAFYWCKDTKYTIVSVQTLNDGSTVTWTNIVDQKTYNAYNIGDILEICDFHEKLVIDE